MPLYSQPVALPRWVTAEPGGVAATNQTFTVGRVMLVQFVVPRTCQIDGVAYTVGTTAAGNVIGGIVGPVSRTSDVPDTGVVVAQSASTAQGSINTTQFLSWTAVTVGPGLYYAALEGDNATGTYMRQANVGPGTSLSLVYDRAGGYGALTSPTPTTASGGGGIPGLRIRIA